MSKIPSKSARVYIDQYAIHGAINAVDADVAQETPNVTCLSDAGPRVVVGNYTHKHAVRGFFDGSDSQIDAITHALVGSTADHYLAEAWQGVTTEGSVAYESIATLVGKPIRVATGQAIVEEFPFEGAGGMSRGLILRSATLAATDTGVSVNQSTPSSDGGTYHATFRFLSGTFTNCVLQVQDSANGTTWGDTTGLTATSTGNFKAVRTTTTAIVRQYLRVLATTISLAGSAEVLVTGGLVAGSTPKLA